MRIRFLLANVLFLGGIAAVSAQSSSQGAASRQADAKQQPTFRVDINYVEVDAVVTGEGGELVRSLSAGDFEVFEDGTRQDIATFKFMDIPVERAPKPSFRKTPVEIDVRSNAVPFDGRLFLLVLDDYHTETLRSAYVKRAATQFIEEHLGANDLAAVVATSGLSQTFQDFTNSKRLMLSAINNFMGKRIRSTTMERLDEYERTKEDREYRDPIKDPLDFERGYKAQMTLDTLDNLAQAMAPIRGRRKAIVFFSEGLDYDIYDIFGSASGTNVMDAARRTIASASRANVTIYSVDPRGLTALGDEAIEISNLPDQSNLPLGQESLFAQLRQDQDSLKVLAEQTGGFAAVNSNDFSTAFDRIIRENSSYYLLGYYSDNERRGTGFRKIEVRVKQPGYKVRARKGYAAPGGKTPSVIDNKSGASADIQAALESPLPVNGLPFAVTAAPFKGTDSNASVVIIVHVDGRPMKFTEHDGLYTTQLELAAVALDARGKVPDWDPVKANLTLKRETYEAVSQSGVRVASRLNLRPGKYQLRIAGRESGSGLVGSVHYDLEVPDFSNDKLSMSGLVLTSGLAAMVPTVRPDEQLKALMPAPPTVSRAFNGAEEIGVFAEIYDNETTPHTVDLKTTVTADDGTTLFTHEEERSSKELGGSTGGYGMLVRIPLMEMPEGIHVLRVEARSRLAPQTVVRETEIAVVRPRAKEGGETAAPAAPSTGMAATSLGSGSQSGIGERREVVIRTPEELSALWAQHAPGTEPPAVAFANRVVVGVFLGEKPTAGYSVEIQKVSRSANALEVQYVERTPAAGAMQAQVITTPFHLVALSNVSPSSKVVFRRAEEPRP